MESQPTKIGIKGAEWKTFGISEETAASSGYVLDCSANPIIYVLLLSLPVNNTGINHLIPDCFISASTLNTLSGELVHTRLPSQFGGGRWPLTRSQTLFFTCILQ